MDAPSRREGRKLCSIGGCTEKAKAKTYCNTHYARAFRGRRDILQIAAPIRRNKRDGLRQIPNTRISVEAYAHHKSHAASRGLTLYQHLASVLEAVYKDHVRHISQGHKQNAWSRNHNPLEEA